MDIQWYPGHMAKTRRIVRDSLKLVDVVIEVLDARIPASSRNPEINALAGSRPRLIVLNKSGLADPGITRRWIELLTGRGCYAHSVDSLTGAGIREIPALVRLLSAETAKKLALSGRRPRAVRCLVLGIPNVGKSLFINKLVGRRAARTGDKPGVTRGEQWVRLAGDIELLDTPGILWPKFADQVVAFRLAATGAIKEEVFDVAAVALELLAWLAEHHPAALRERYKLARVTRETGDLLEEIGRKRGFLVSGGSVDQLKAARHILKEFRDGILGRFTMDEPILS